MAFRFTLKISALKFAALAAAGLCAMAPAFADPAGVRISSKLIVDPVEQVTAQEKWDFANAYKRHNLDKEDVPGVWLAQDTRGHGEGEWRPVSLMKVAFKDSEEPVIVRLWSRRGGLIFVKDLPAANGDVASYEIRVGYDSFTLSSKPDGSITADGARIGELKRSG